MLNLTQDQTMELDLLLMRLQADGIITDDQRRDIMRAALGLPVWTEEDDRKEQAWEDSLRLTAKDKADLDAAWREITGKDS